jgi:hypothetical protein
MLERIEGKRASRHAAVKLDARLSDIANISCPHPRPPPF